MPTTKKKRPADAQTEATAASRPTQPVSNATRTTRMLEVLHNPADYIGIVAVNSLTGAVTVGGYEPFLCQNILRRELGFPLLETTLEVTVATPYAGKGQDSNTERTTRMVQYFNADQFPDHTHIWVMHARNGTLRSYGYDLLACQNVLRARWGIAALAAGSQQAPRRNSRSASGKDTSAEQPQTSTTAA
jgi:hypothetical protein